MTHYLIYLLIYSLGKGDSTLDETLYLKVGLVKQTSLIETFYGICYILPFVLFIHIHFASNLIHTKRFEDKIISHSSSYYTLKRLGECIMCGKWGQQTNIQ